jgi:hypothetical protein
MSRQTEQTKETSNMPDPTAVLRDAIEKKLSVSATYNGYVREMCPHVLGTKKGKQHCFFFQFAGQSSKGLPAGGEWRCIPLSGLTVHKVYGGPWHTGEGPLEEQTCVDTVDVQVAV